MVKNPPALFLLASLGLILIWSFVHPADRFTWWMESFPVFIAAPLLFATRKNFRFTMLVYIGLWAHAIILLVGAHYTYAEVPLFNWLRDVFSLSRNHYDRLGHFAQGFVPALVARELLLRTSPLRAGKWLFAIVTLSCLGISAMYELLEWMVSAMKGEAADAFLGTQGDVWDTQKDMLMALIGAMTAQALLGKYHNRLIGKM
jgi:putative membrane protein